MQGVGIDEAPRLRMAGLRSALVGPFDLALEPGRCMAVSGASGAGKSLFLRLVADLDPGEGEAWVDGVSRASLTGPQWRKRVVYVAAESGWWRERAIDHVAAEHASGARELALLFGLKPDRLTAPVQELSSGERQRLSLIRALALFPPVLLLDEPTGPLDPESTRAVEAVLQQRLAAGVAMILVTHDPVQADRMGAERWRMVDRRLERAP